MSKVIVLFNLKEGVSVTAYEDWAQNTDLPMVNKLPGVDNFEVLRTISLFGSMMQLPINILRLSIFLTWKNSKSLWVMKLCSVSRRSFKGSPIIRYL